MRPQGNPGVGLVERMNPDVLMPSVWEHKQDRNLDLFFNAVDSEQKRVRFSEWFKDRYIVGGAPGQFSKMYSKCAWRYGYYILSTRFATQCSTWQLFGAEAGGGGQSTCAFFMLGDPHFWNRFDGHGNFTRVDLNILTHLPATYNTAAHTYVLKVNRNNIMAFIDGKLISVCLLGSPTGALVANVQPYCLASIASQYCDANLFFGLEGGTESVSVGPLYENSPYAMDGAPITPILIKAYKINTSTLWQGLATGGDAQTSHPIPVWGYPNKTFLFQATGAGSLQMQMYAGDDWQDHGDPIVVGANKLEVYNLDAEVPYARCVYDPENNDTITLAEWSLS